MTNTMRASCENRLELRREGLDLLALFDDTTSQRRGGATPVFVLDYELSRKQERQRHEGRAAAIHASLCKTQSNYGAILSSSFVLAKI